MILARLVAFTILAAGTAAFAQEAPKLPPFQLKNKSTFGIKSGTRTPFWPIGWKKGSAPVVAAPGLPVAVKAFQIQPNHFIVSSVLLSHPPLATINGRAFGEGEPLPVQIGDQPVKVIVKAIRDGGVWLDQAGHQIFVPLRRQSVPTRTAPEIQAAPEFKILIEEK